MINDIMQGLKPGQIITFKHKPNVYHDKLNNYGIILYDENYSLCFAFACIDEENVYVIKNGYEIESIEPLHGDYEVRYMYYTSPFSSKFWASKEPEKKQGIARNGRLNVMPGYCYAILEVNPIILNDTQLNISSTSYELEESLFN